MVEDNKEKKKREGRKSSMCALNNKIISKEDPEFDFEFLKKLNQPVRIKVMYGSSKANVVNLPPYFEVVNQFETYLKKHNLSKKRFSQENMIKDDSFARNRSLHNKLRFWSYVIDCSTSPYPFLEKLGVERFAQRHNLEEYKSGVLELFSKEFIMDVFSKGSNKLDVIRHVKNSSKRLQSIYDARKYRTRQSKENSVSAVLDSAFPDIKVRTGYLPSEILGFTPLSDERLEEKIRHLFFSGEDIRPSALKKNPQNKKIAHHIVYPFSRPEFVGQNIGFKNGFHKELGKYLGFDEGLNFQLNQHGARSTLARAMEFEVSFFMNILRKYDSNLSEFPELKKLIGSPLQKINDPSLIANKKLFHEQERFSDGSFICDDKSFAIEVKKSVYENTRSFFASLSKYHKNKWATGEHIGGKLLFVDDVSNGSLDNLKKEWSLLKGNEYKVLYNRALDLLFSDESSFERVSPLTNKESLLKISDLIHENSHLLVRNGHEFFRKIIPQLYINCFNVLENGTEGLAPFISFNKEYSLRLSEINAYPVNAIRSAYNKDLENVIENIEVGDLFLDGEFSGFRNTGSYAFMMAIGEKIPNDFLVTIYFARSPLEEKELLLKTIDKIKSSKRVITYNGSGFDLPFIYERSIFNLIDFKFDKPHLDLYSQYYAPYSKMKGYVKKSTKIFEKRELGFHRRGDVSGDQIPRVVGDFLLGDESLLVRDLIVHNFVDVLSLAYIFLHKEGFRFDKPGVSLDFNNIFGGLNKYSV